MKKVVLSLLLVACFIAVHGQVKRVLFLGNSYTYANDLPGLIEELAISAGDTLYTDSNTPGGYTLGYSPIQHLTNSISLGKIRSGNWDYVVLQEQSQIPAIPVLRDSCMLPAAISLYDSVKLYNPCAEVLFYLTWGRRFGGTQCFVPNYCSTGFTDFGQMQDSLTRSYLLVAEAINQPVAPVGEAWRLVINNTPMVLHGSDNSHPSLNGSYLSACVFYACILKKPSFGLAYTAGLQYDSAAILQKAADSIAFSNPGLYNLWENEVISEFSYQLNNELLSTENRSRNSTSCLWDFGDGSYSYEFEPSHTYSQSGIYSLKLKACNDCECDSSSKEINVNITTSPSITIEHGVINLSGPDNSDHVYFNGFSGHGFLWIYNLHGKRIINLPVTNGSATLHALPRSIYIWELISYNKIISRGKILIIE